MGGTILLADDSLTIQKVVELTFAETDHTVVAVGGGRELLERMAAIRPDVILCDVVMPDMTGYDVCQALKSDPARLHIPVVLLTGTFEPFDRDRAMAAGCDAIVTKPFEARELIDTVEQLIARTKVLAVQDEGPVVEGIGVPDGVPALDFTTTGFDKMVPPQAAPLLAPEEGIELTASSVPSLEQAPASAGPLVEAAFEPGEKTAPPFAFEPEPPGPKVGADEGPWGSTPQGATPPEETGVAHGLDGPDGVEDLAASQPAAVDQAAVEPVAALPPAVVTAGAAAGADPGSFELSEEQIERIARRVVELAGSQIEQIAWEVIPDMAEMIVRQRIQELESAAEREN